MPKHRAGRLAGEIQKEVGQLIGREIKDPRLTLASVVEVDVSSDGTTAKIFISPMPGSEYSKSDVEQALESAKGFIRRQLGQRLKVRMVPELFFQVDESIEKGIRMMKIIEAQIAADQAAAAGRPPLDTAVYEEEIE